ncbi:hypothetical protein BCR41DRAFT_371508 [Lobosporangium transversale]|uniref:Uncharacterized protein n=1 Tax=Lobosporangium transversale TaxID=64571 RepID=A0A1Y2GK64_9FUNG|nr:hypothetical protein BCR41DRAFT_371508 [Lobosporangium transversale]ORZ13377.1 hypothetical protein BCR41DRAFT_371508 [Lobosporangium transversale]|eukprot:XP_021880458.1 hypothetical protein BCR41DRAFT_371508 [Lobosporangium transversale]
MSAPSASTSSSADPRRSDHIVEYKPEVKRIEDDDPDVHGFVALCAALHLIMHHIISIRLRNRTCLWLGMIFSVESYLNQRASEGGLMGSPTATILFSVSSLVMNYMPEILAAYSGVKT